MEFRNDFNSFAAGRVRRKTTRQTGRIRLKKKKMIYKK